MPSRNQQCSENARHNRIRFEVFHSDENYVMAFRLSTPLYKTQAQMGGY